MSVSSEQSNQLVVELTRVYKLLRALNATSPRFHDSVEVSAYPLLFAVNAEPTRVTDLAARVHTDASVVSRQIRQLEQLGLVAKTCDPDDRRASRVAVTAEGAELVTRIQAGRGEWMAGILTGWTPDQAESFLADLTTFTSSLRAELDAPSSVKETP